MNFQQDPLQEKLEQTIRSTLSRKHIPTITFTVNLSYRNDYYSVETVITSCTDNLYSKSVKDLKTLEPIYKYTNAGASLINEINRSVRELCTSVF